MTLALLLALAPDVRGPLIEQATDRVGRLLRARTKTSAGVTVGQFTGDTIPDRDQVKDLVEDAAQDVFITAGDTFQSATEPGAWVLISIRAAMLVEQSYWPEQTTSEDSNYARLRDLYNDGLTHLVTRVNDDQAGATRVFTAEVTGDTAASSPLLDADLLLP